MCLMTKGHWHEPTQGIALYEIGCKFTHSCSPNAIHRVDENGDIEVRLLQDVEENEPIKYSYIDQEELVLYPGYLRLQEIKQRRLLQCSGCERCGFGEEIEDGLPLVKNDIDQYYSDTIEKLEDYIPNCEEPLK